MLVLVAASLTVLIGCGAFVLDLGNQRQTARNEQNAADAGALAGAVGLPKSATLSGTAFQTAAHYASTTLVGRSATEISCPGSAEQPPPPTKCYEPTDASDGTIVYVTTPWGPDSIADGNPAVVAPAENQVHVKVCTDVETGLAKIFGVGDLRPCREATAINTLSSALPFAFGAMAASGSGTFTSSGGGSVNVTGSVVVNSNTDGGGPCDAALLLGGGSSLTATAIEVRDPDPSAPPPPSGWEACPGNFSPLPTNSFSSPHDDPLCPNPSIPSLPCLSYPGDPGCPAPANCNSTTIEAPGDTIWPGVYDEIIVNSGTLTMMPGLYVFRGTGGGSKFEINGGTVIGNGVTLFFACQDYPATCGGGDTVSYLSLGENPVTCPPPSPPSCTPSPPATVTFNSPPPGSYPDERIPGMAIFFDRNAPQSSSGPPGIGIFGDASLNVTGTIYAPSILFQTVSSTPSTLKSAVIVNKFDHQGSGNLTVTYAEDENVKVTGGIALIT